MASQFKVTNERKKILNYYAKEAYGFIEDFANIRIKPSRDYVKDAANHFIIHERLAHSDYLNQAIHEISPRVRNLFRGDLISVLDSIRNSKIKASTEEELGSERFI